MKADLVMWTKNGALTLPVVLNRISQVVPESVVGQRLVVDDQSSDPTRQVARRFGWRVVQNEGAGVADGANTALKHVESSVFFSFEQDLLLALDWWPKIPQLLENPKVAVACGMRFASQPAGLRNLQLYVAEKYRGASGLPAWLRSREASSFTLGKTLDNTAYKTDVVRKVDGFPKLETNAGVDTLLAYRLQAAGYQWKVDGTVKSTHLRSQLAHELAHQEWYGRQIPSINRALKRDCQVNPSISPLGAAFRFMFSPLTGLFVALQTGDATVAYIHPLVKLHYTKGLLEGSHG